MQLVEDLKIEGYTFVYKDNSVRKQMPRRKAMTSRVRKSLTDYNKSRDDLG